MDFEHMFQQTNTFMAIQMMFMSSLLVPGIIGRMDLYGRVVRVLASNVVSFGPFGLLAYVLYNVSNLH